MRLALSLRRFGRERKGLAAIEFAFLLPVMVFVLLASVDLINALGTYRRAENVAASLADVISRDTSVSNAEITGLWSAVAMLMYPDTDTVMSERVSSVMINSATSATVVWSEAHNGATQLSVGSTVALPPQMMIAGSSLIMAETTYHYTSPMHFLFPSSVNFSHTVYRRSRLVDPIQRVP
ncbi:MAG: pilus assembly protein [Proteobacteria bacterium]|nr:pilus assembly protein [Pseudomonadota bacterium]